MVSRKIQQFEQSILDRSIRICGVFSENGKKIFEKEENSSRQFSFTDPELQTMEHKILTSNDGIGGVGRGEIPSELFLKDDIRIAVDRQLIELRLVTKSGTYSLKPPSRNWPTFETICETYKRQREYRDAFEFEKKFREDCVAEGLDYQNDYNWYIQHYIWEKVAQSLGLRYQRIP